MKRYEKILTVIVAVLFAIQLLPNFAETTVFLTLTTWLLALSYFIGGYWLFNPKENKKYFLPITAGVAFGVSIIALPLILRLELDGNGYYVLPILNGLLCIGLTIYLIVNRKTEKVTNNVKNIFKRAVIILAVSSFFTYTPISFKPFLKVLIALNNGNASLVNNLLMLDYTAELEDALDKDDCDKAIEFALKANKSGKVWLGIYEGEEQGTDTKSELLNKWFQDSTTKISPENENSLKEFTNQNDLSKISGTYSNLYKAYRCKAGTEFGNNQFNEALLNYKTAHKYLTACDQSKYWDKQKSWALNDIALCYENLNKFTLADSFYVEAINNYKKVIDTADNGLAEIYSNLARSLSEESQFEYSNNLFQAANSILRKDTANVNNRKDLVTNYNGLVKNYLKQDSLENAMFFIKRAMKFANKNEAGYCATTIYYAVCLYRLDEYQKSDSVAKTCLQCIESQPKGNRQNIAECNLLLSQINIALAKYDEAKKYVNTGIEITTKNFGSNSSRYANYLKVLAQLNKIVGEYPTSEKQYNQVIEIYTRELGDRNNELPNVLAGLADLEIILSRPNSAKKHSDNSLSIASIFMHLTTPITTNLLNEAAYVNYCLGFYKPADTLYRKVIKINADYGRTSDATTAIALNGLGLIETARKSYKKADLLFQQSLELHIKLFTDNNPLTAIVYLNYGSLCIQEGKLAEAEEKINKALTIDKQFFKSDHDIFADIFVALGDLAKRKSQNTIAKDYYRKALDIYKKKFNDEHWKVITTQQKLND